MQALTRGFALAVVGAVIVLTWARLPALAQAEEPTHRWFSLPIEISGLPPEADGVPVSSSVDFTEILKGLGVPGTVDENSLRLSGVFEGRWRELAVQFSAAPQPRAAQRRLLPGTTPSVSYLGEHAAGDPSQTVKVAGALTWLARADAQGKQTYRLRFGVLRRGRFVQVPYPPQNLRAFDEQGRATPISCFPVMQIRPQWPLDGMLHLSQDNRLVTTYHLGPVLGQPTAGPLRRSFLYPVIGPDGVGLTEFGKAHDPTGSHAHHYSFWVAHSSVAGHDFWSERGGSIAHDQWELLEDGPVFCRLVLRTRWLFDKVECLRERRSLTLYRLSGNRLPRRHIDVELEFSPPADKPVELGKTTFGFLAVRVAQSMTPFDGGGEILNSHGDRNEQAVHLKRADWLDQSGPILDGEQERQGPHQATRRVPVEPDRLGAPRWGGIAMLDHPGNPEHPTGWHCRNDGWACPSFCMERAHTLEPGKPLRLRYRVVLHRGNAADAGVAGQYAAYAAQPTVRLGAVKAE